MKVYISFILTFNLIFQIQAACPTGSLPSLSDPSKCYSFISSPSEFLNAEQTCVDLNGHLTSVGDGFINAFLSENAQTIFKRTNSSDFWIGGNDLSSSGVWAWTDGLKWTYDSWSPGNPQNSAGLDCVSTQISNGLWLSSNCYNRKPFVCELSPLPEAHCHVFCDSGWTYFNESNSCYKTFFNQKWHDAEGTCVSNNAHLVSIHSPTENSFVAGMSHTNLKVSTEHQSWIGLYTNDRNSNWAWTDGSPVDFYNWAPKQPDNPGKEDCVEIFSDNSEHSNEKGWYEKYNNFDCNTEVRAFVCKKPANVQ
uniref:C-type lectin domain-containing protein n=1 Tax=Panagrolaimus sp. PS1159 TaxID=55785 RepID=A0AC35G070_9BILA